MIAAQGGDQDAFALGEAGHIGVGHHVIRMLVVAHAADIMAHVEQVGGGFQQFAGRRRQLVQGLQRGEELRGDVGHAPRTFERDAVAAPHVFHFAALVAAQAREFGAHVARRQVGDDAVAHSGAASNRPRAGETPAESPAARRFRAR